MIAQLISLALHTELQYHADIDAIGIVLHVLKLVHLAVLDADRYTLLQLALSCFPFFCVSLFYYLTVLVTLLMYTVEIKINEYVMPCKHCINDSYNSNIISCL